MAGIKRKHETNQGAALSGSNSASLGHVPTTADSSLEDGSNIRITRSARASQDARAHNMNIPSALPAHSNPNTTTITNNGRPSRIVTLSTKTARANSARQALANNTTAANPGRETRTSRARAAAAAAVAPAAPSAPVLADNTAAADVPETPRSKRVKRAPTVEETPRTTRQSARLRAHIPSTDIASADSRIDTKPLDASPSAALVPGGRTRTRSRQMIDVTNDTFGNLNSSFDAVAASSPSKPTLTKTAEDIASPVFDSARKSTKEQTTYSDDEDISMKDASDKNEEKMTESKDSQVEEKSSQISPLSPAGSIQRNSPSSKNGADTHDTPQKKPKLEDADIDHASSQQIREVTENVVDGTPTPQPSTDSNNGNSNGVGAGAATAEVGDTTDLMESFAGNSNTADAGLASSTNGKFADLDDAVNITDADAVDAADDATPAAQQTVAENESRQITEEAEEPVSENGVSVVTSGGRGRGRGRGRGGGLGGSTRGGALQKAKAKLKGKGKGKGKVKGKGRGRKGQDIDQDPDAELEPEPARSPSPTPATQQLRDRQRELDKAFKRVAAAQRLALSVLAEHSQRKLARDKNAHKKVPEYEQINQQLKDRLEARKESLRQEYEYKVATANRMLAFEKENIEQQFRIKCREIQDEHLLASQGAYMAFVEGRRAAEDDEHTETDESETEAEPGRIRPPAKELKRGYVSSFIRNPAGAGLCERALHGWDDFVQRAKLREDIEPQMNDMEESGPFPGLSAHDVISLIIEATGVIQTQDATAAAEINKAPPPPLIPESRPEALFALADAALASNLPPPRTVATPRSATHRTILPQPPQSQVIPGPTDPRSFVLPPPNLQRQQPRRLLPAGQLPDPFAARTGPPQLPPPPGSNFQRPPLPGFLPGPPPPPLYYPHPPPPGPGVPPPGPRPPF